MPWYQGWDGLRFEPLTIEEVVPAPGQGAIAVECREGEQDW